MEPPELSREVARVRIAAQKSDFRNIIIRLLQQLLRLRHPVVLEVAKYTDLLFAAENHAQVTRTDTRFPRQSAPDAALTRLVQDWMATACHLPPVAEGRRSKRSNSFGRFPLRNGTKL